MSKLWQFFNSAMIIGIIAGQLMAFTPGAGSQTATVTRPPVSPEKAGMHFANLPAGLELPVRLSQPLDVSHATVGDTIIAATTHDIIVSGDILPEGTKVFGHVEEEPGSNQPMVAFDRLEFSTGTIIPIATSIVRGLKQPEDRVSLAELSNVSMGTRLVLRLSQRAQIAANGNIL